jgi:hypothetical protein
LARALRKSRGEQGDVDPDDAIESFQVKAVAIGALVVSAKDHRVIAKDYSDNITDLAVAGSLMELISGVVNHDRDKMIDSLSIYHQILGRIDTEHWLMERMITWVMECKYITHLLISYQSENYGKPTKYVGGVPDDMTHVVGILVKDQEEQRTGQADVPKPQQASGVEADEEDEWEWFAEDRIAARNWCKKDLHPKITLAQWLSSAPEREKQAAQAKEAAEAAAKLFKNWIVTQMRVLSARASGAEFYAEHMHVKSSDTYQGAVYMSVPGSLHDI